MAIMQITVNTRFQGVSCINRWNYQSDGVPSGTTRSFDLATAFGLTNISPTFIFPAGSIMEAWQDLVADQVTFVSFEVRDVYNPNDFIDSPIPAGTIGLGGQGNSLSPAVAFGFRTNRTRTDISRATKRFVGVTEGQNESGGAIAAATLADMQILADRMGQSINSGTTTGGVNYTPIVVSKEPYTTPSGRTAYRYYPTEAEQNENIMAGITWTPYEFTRTQVSRQYGRGQ